MTLNRNPESGFRQRESGILFLLGVDVRVESGFFHHGSARYLRGRFLQWNPNGGGEVFTTEENFSDQLARILVTSSQKDGCW